MTDSVKRAALSDTRVRGRRHRHDARRGICALRLHNVACPHCGARLDPGQKFCAECGLALGAALPELRRALRGQPQVLRRVRLRAGGIADAGRCNADATRATRRRRSDATCPSCSPISSASRRCPRSRIPRRYASSCRATSTLPAQVIEGYGGTVEKFIGDAVMAVWGAPVAREDDPERAVRAALELVERVAWHHHRRSAACPARRQCCPVRLPYRSAPAGQGMVAGDLVNTASRLQSVAQPGIVLVGEVDLPGNERRDRLRAGRRAGAQGQAGAGRRVACAARRRAQ